MPALIVLATIVLVVLAVVAGATVGILFGVGVLPEDRGGGSSRSHCYPGSCPHSQACRANTNTCVPCVDFDLNVDADPETRQIFWDPPDTAEAHDLQLTYTDITGASVTINPWDGEQPTDAIGNFQVAYQAASCPISGFDRALRECNFGCPYPAFCLSSANDCIYCPYVTLEVERTGDDIVWTDWNTNTLVCWGIGTNIFTAMVPQGTNTYTLPSGAESAYVMFQLSPECAPISNLTLPVAGYVPAYGFSLLWNNNYAVFNEVSGAYEFTGGNDTNTAARFGTELITAGEFRYYLFDTTTGHYCRNQPLIGFTCDMEQKDPTWIWNFYRVNTIGGTHLNTTTGSCTVVNDRLLCESTTVGVFDPVITPNNIP